MASPSEGSEVRFERDIKPMFGTKDRDSMLQAFDLFGFRDDRSVTTQGQTGTGIHESNRRR